MTFWLDPNTAFFFAVQIALSTFQWTFNLNCKQLKVKAGGSFDFETVFLNL